MHKLSVKHGLALLAMLSCAEPEPLSSREPAPAPTKAPPPAPQKLLSAPAIVTGVLVRRGDEVEICPGRYVWACPGVRVEGKVEDAWISEGDNVTTWRLRGIFDGTTLVLDGPALPATEPGPSSISRAELEHLRTRADQILRRQGVRWSSSAEDIVNNRITYDAEAIDAATLAELARETHDAIRVVAFIELLEHGLAQMPMPAMRGDVELITKKTRSGGGMSALGRFEVHYDPALRCVHFGARESDGRVLPVWPFGYWATSSPFTLYDHDGNVVATEGQTIELGGGFVDIEHAHADNECGARQAWLGRPPDPVLPARKPR